MTQLITKTLNSLQEQKSQINSWNISWRLGVILKTLVEVHKPKSILEIGTSNGFSSLWICLGLDEDSKLTTIEIDSSRFDEAKKNFQLAGVSENIFQFNGDVFEVLESLDSKFDFIFLDAAHKNYSKVIDLLVKQNILTENAIIVCDNVLSHSYMSKFISTMRKEFSCDLIEVDSGFLVARKKFIL